MYNDMHKVEEVFLEDELKAIPKSSLIPFVEGAELDSIQGWIDTFKGIVTVYFRELPLKVQTIHKKPFIVIKDPIRRRYVLWTEGYMMRK